ncbi:CAP domain-containing protein [Streptomyces sp. NBC_00829]|uniref:CAP domain-containing protein n=1 Tax=Streptomyces sp. NBC_00829 TaxID=2903679 RepID=UPI003863BA44|nr:CAP domain-containing protein [Streptomyces sp. NBC_00829]
MNHRRNVNRKAKAVTGLVLGGALTAGVAALWPGAAQARLPGTDQQPTDRPQQTPAFAPYADASVSPSLDLPAWAKGAGVKEINLGFINRGSGCIPEWSGSSGSSPLDRNAVAAQIDALRKAGGDVRVVFGGDNGAELATVCSDSAKLSEAYKKVISQFKLTKLNFDIDGYGLHMPEVNSLRSKALASLQKSDPKLDVAFTLPTLPNGLTPDGVKVLEDAQKQGVRISAVNITPDDFGTAGSGDMGKLAIDGATAAQRQIKETLGLSEEAAWQKLAITPTIGANGPSGAKGKVFGLKDAEKVVAFAQSKKVAWLSMSTANRDKPCTSAGGPAGPTCSGVDQKPFAFSKIFATYRGGGSGTPDPQPTPSSTSTSTPAPTPTSTSTPAPTPTEPTPTPTEPKPPSNPDGTPAALGRQVIALANAERAKAGCPAVRENNLLNKAALGHSEDMASRNFFDHTNPDGKDPGARITAAGYQWSTYGENIAKGQATPADVMKSWMESSGHRRNILDCKFKEIGMGVRLGSGGPWWTQAFGTSR